MTFFRSLSFKVSADAIVFAVGFANSVLITRILGPTGRGHYVLLATTINLLALFFGEGLRRSNAYLVGKDRSRARRLFPNTIFWGGTVGFLLLGLFLLGQRWLWFSKLAEVKDLLLVTLLIAVATVLFRGFCAIFLGLERMVEYNLTPVFFILLYFCGNLIALKVLDLGLPGVMSSRFLAVVIVSGLAVFLLWRAIHLPPLQSEKVSVEARKGLDTALLHSSLRLGFKGMLISLLLVLLFRVDIYLVNHFLGPGLTGIYSISIVFAEMLQKVPNAAGTVLFSKIGSREQKWDDQLTATVCRFVFLLTLVLALVLVTCGKWLIPFLFGEHFSGVYLPLVCMLPGVIAIASGSIINTNLWGRGYPLLTVIAPAVALSVNIGLNLLLIPTVGLVGAGLATSVAYTLWGVLIFSYFVRNSSLSLPELIWPKASDLLILKGRIEKRCSLR
ncbi:MAG: polysaccharide biosynthesis C-terminal domain-containing protein [Candidatus Latescibacteria bacterium]|nr:polysaccharide biosynthesis C-terminal domain-containing protein [Candidatus Latescibacterota bacterium]